MWDLNLFPMFKRKDTGSILRKKKNYVEKPQKPMARAAYPQA